MGRRRSRLQPCDSGAQRGWRGKVRGDSIIVYRQEVAADVVCEIFRCTRITLDGLDSLTLVPRDP